MTLILLDKFIENMKEGHVLDKFKFKLSQKGISGNVVDVAYKSV